MLSLFFTYQQKLSQVLNVTVYAGLFIDVWRLCAVLQFHVRVCEAIILICNWWELEEFKTTYKLVFNRF